MNLKSLVELKNKVKSLERKKERALFGSRKMTELFFWSTVIYFFLIVVPVLYLTKKRMKVKKIVIGHYHLPFKFGDIEVLETYIFRGKVYEFGEFKVITDIHLGLINYDDKRLKELLELVKKEKLIILGDLTEKYPVKKLDELEKEILNEVKRGVNEGRIILIKGNHDPKIDGQKLYFIYDHFFFSHGHFSSFPFFFSDFLKILNRKNNP